MPLICSLLASRKSRGDIQPPITRAPTRNNVALPTIHTTSRVASWPPVLAAVMTPETTARITRPRTSSMTAAPRMILASRVVTLPRSVSTRAVMPTLVAQSVAPMNRWTSRSSFGSIQAETPQPRKNGATTPRSATSRLEVPTDIISRTLDSSPTSNSSSTTPISAMMAMPSLEPRKSRPWKPNSTRLPRMTPAISSPSTAGWWTRSASSPPTLAASSMITRPNSTGVTGLA